METYVRDSLRVSQGTGFLDEPLRAKWQSLYAPDTANVLTFSPGGEYLALGTTESKILVWELLHGRTLVRTLRIPQEAVDGEGGVLSLAWSGDTRLVFAGTGKAVVVFDFASGLPLRVLLMEGLLGPGNAPRVLRPHPTLRGILMVVPWVGMPWVFEWSGEGVGGILGGSTQQLSDALLPPPKKRTLRTQLAREASVKGGRVKGLRCDAMWGGGIAPSPGTLYLFTSRGDLCRLKLAALETVVEGSGSGSGSGGSGGSGSAVHRLAYTYTAPPVLPPEIMSVSGCGGPSYTSSTTTPLSLPGGEGGVLPPLLPPAVAITTRAGVMLHDIVTLQQGERYSEPVDNTVMVTARVGKGGTVVYSLPHEDAGHAAGGMYAFRRGCVGDIRLKRPPVDSGGLVRFAVHPLSGTIAGIGSRGSAFILQEPLLVTWPGPMYPPGFILTTQNKEYAEPEDELDLINEQGKLLFRTSVVEDSAHDLDCFTRLVPKHTYLASASLANALAAASGSPSLGAPMQQVQTLRECMDAMGHGGLSEGDVGTCLGKGEGGEVGGEGDFDPLTTNPLAFGVESACPIAFPLALVTKCQGVWRSRARDGAAPTHSAKTLHFLESKAALAFCKNPLGVLGEDPVSGSSQGADWRRAFGLRPLLSPAVLNGGMDGGSGSGSGSGSSGGGGSGEEFLEPPHDVLVFGGVVSTSSSTVPSLASRLPPSTPLLRLPVNILPPPPTEPLQKLYATQMSALYNALTGRPLQKAEGEDEKHLAPILQALDHARSSHHSMEVEGEGEGGGSSGSGSGSGGRVGIGGGGGRRVYDPKVQQAVSQALAIHSSTVERRAAAIQSLVVKAAITAPPPRALPMKASTAPSSSALGGGGGGGGGESSGGATSRPKARKSKATVSFSVAGGGTLPPPLPSLPSVKQ